MGAVGLETPSGAGQVGRLPGYRNNRRVFRPEEDAAESGATHAPEQGPKTWKGEATRITT